MSFYQKVRKDVQKGVKEGVHLLREGAAVVKEKAEGLAEEGKRRYKIFELKTKVQKEIEELGGRVYDLSAKVKNPLLDKKVKAIIARVKKLEKQVIRLEGKKMTGTGKTITKRATRAKQTK